MCITGLPNSNLSTVTQGLLEQLQCGTFMGDRHTHFYHTSAVRTIDESSKQLVYSKEFHYSTVIESAINHHLFLKGQYIRNIERPNSNMSIFNDKELNTHLINIIRDFYIAKNKKHTDNPMWIQGLPSGISMIKIWEIGMSKAASYILPFLSGHLYNSYVWMLFDIINDLPSLYEPPEIKEKSMVEFHFRLHYLLHSAKLAAQKYTKRTNVCKLISYNNSSKMLSEETKVFKDFQSDVTFAAIQMEVDDLVDTDEILKLHSGMKDLKQLKKHLMILSIKD